MTRNRKGEFKAEKDPVISLICFLAKHKQYPVTAVFLPNGSPTLGIYEKKGDDYLFRELPYINDLLLEFGSFILILQKVLKEGFLVSCVSEKLCQQGFFGE